MRSPTLTPRFLAISSAAVILAASASARADVSSWLFLGGGTSGLSQQGGSYELLPTLQLDLGVGLPPSYPVVVGAIGRMSTFFGEGTDLGLGVRTATRGYCVGDWGVALDAGGFERWWGPGSGGFMGSIQVGAPFGFTLSLNSAFGSDSNTTFGAVVGVDLLRLTVYRLGGENWWENPRPAWRPE